MFLKQDIRKQYYLFITLFFGMIKNSSLLFLTLVAFSLLSALTEGFGIGLIIPLMNQDNLNDNSFILNLDRFFSYFVPINSINKTVSIFGLLMLIIILRGLLQVIVSYYSIILPLRIRERLSQDGYDATLDIDLNFFSNSDGGVLHAIIQEYPNRISSSFKAAIDLIINFLLAFVYTAIMFVMSWKMTLVALSFVGAFGLLFKWILMWPLQKTGVALSESQENWNSLIHETGLGVKLIRLLSAESFLSHLHSRLMKIFFYYETRRQLIGEIQSPLLTTMSGLMVCSIFIYSTVGESQIIPMSQLLVLVICLYRLTGPVSRIFSSIVIINASLDAMHRQVSLPRQEKNLEHISLSKPVNLISFKSVTYTYPGNTRQALNNFSIDIHSGEMVALVGPSGSGKSTIVNLLGGLYKPQKGSIEINGLDLRYYRIEEWRRRIAIVSQEVTLFNMSIAENLMFGLRDKNISDMESAAERAAALDFIRDLPNGWDTRIGDRGVRLSGGQQQRLSIARAILRDPDLLILDEATSQLDSLTELTIQEVIESFRGKKSVLAIAHRLSTIRRADRICVLSNGEAIETGSHDDLFGYDSNYRKMLKAQQLDVLYEV